MKRRLPAPLRYLAALLALYLLVPLLAGVRQLPAADWHGVDAHALLDASAVSIASASVATLLVALGAVPLGYLLARSGGRVAASVSVLVQLPLALPPLTSGILLLFLLGYATPLGRLTGGFFNDSFAGIVAAEAFVAAPFLIAAARAGFAQSDQALEQVAATLGRSAGHVFWHVSVPIAWPSILAGLLMTWLRAFGEFGATVMLAYHPYSLPVYTYVAFGAQGLPAMLPVVLPTLVLALLILGFISMAARPRRQRPAQLRDPGASPRPAAALLPEVLPPDGRTVAARPGAPCLSLSLKRRLGDFQLQIDWRPTAQRLGVLGSSGSGKSLTLKLLAGVEPLDEGSILLEGRELAGLPAAARSVGYVPQNYALFPPLTVIGQLRFPAGSDLERAQEWLQRLGLRGLEGRRPDELSLGQQQRVALARALMRPARLLLLDEPFSALDAPLRTRLRLELLQLQRRLPLISILVTHDPAEAALLADELLLLEGGAVLQTGPTREVFRRPAGPLAARLLGALGTGRGIVAADGAVLLADGTKLAVAGPPLRPGQPVGWAVPASAVRLHAAGRYRGVIEQVACVGAEWEVTLRLADVTLQGRVASDRHTAGAACSFDLDAAAVQVWPCEAAPD